MAFPEYVSTMLSSGAELMSSTKPFIVKEYKVKRHGSVLQSCLIGAIIFVTMQRAASLYISSPTHETYWDAIQRIIGIIMKKNEGGLSPKDIEKKYHRGLYCYVFKRFLAEIEKHTLIPMLFYLKRLDLDKSCHLFW